MKYALINDKKTEATKGANGLCPYCDSELIAKCGEVKIHHWAHKGNRNCDPWWENETEWHRSWKDNFPIDWQEVIQFDESGEKHIADVKTENGWVLEFQHSYLTPEERRARNAFYPKLVWVVDGLRRKRDKIQFLKVLEESTVISTRPPIRRVHYLEECRLLKEWHDSSSLIFFDFQEVNELKQSDLWLLYFTTPKREAYLIPFSHDDFIKYHHGKEFDEIVETLPTAISNILANNKRSNRSNRPSGLERYPANRLRRKRRF